MYAADYWMLPMQFSSSPYCSMDSTRLRMKTFFFISNTSYNW